MQGDRAGHDALLADGRSAAPQHPRFAWQHQVACTCPALLAGRWQEAERRIRKAAEVGALKHNPPVTPVALVQRLFMRRAQGRTGELREEFEQRAGGLGWLGDHPQANDWLITAAELAWLSCREPRAASRWLVMLSPSEGLPAAIGKQRHR